MAFSVFWKLVWVVMAGGRWFLLLFRHTFFYLTLSPGVLVVFTVNVAAV